MWQKKRWQNAKYRQLKRSFFGTLPSSVLTSFYFKKLICLSSNPNHTISSSEHFLPKIWAASAASKHITTANKFLFLLSFHTMHTILGIVPSIEILMEWCPKEDFYVCFGGCFCNNTFGLMSFGGESKGRSVFQPIIVSKWEGTAHCNRCKDFECLTIFFAFYEIRFRNQI